jgi:alkylation response protein AidB-like acyl-CoA dehydrogenase
MADGLVDTLSLKHCKVLDAFRNLSPEIVERADEIEQGRRVPPDLIDKIEHAGLFRLLLPRFYGGEDLHPLQASRVIEELSRADGTMGWHGMNILGFNVILAYFQREFTDEVFSAGPDVRIRGALAPKGIAVPTKGGYMVQGRWPLASGSFEPTWLLGNCIVLEDGKPRMGANGIPQMRAVLVPRDRAEIIDTWDAVGLRGTESNDVVMKEQFVPERQTADPFFGKATWDMPVFKLPLQAILAPSHGSISVGIAQGALDDLGILARDKKPAFGGGKRLHENPHFAYRYGELCARTDALRAYLERGIMESIKAIDLPEPPGPLLSARTSAMAAYVQVQGVDIVNEVFTLAGASACYSTSTIQRRWRDTRCVAQHAAASTDCYATLGALRVEAGPPPRDRWGA